MIQEHKRKRGKPVVHPPVLNPKNGKIFLTYTEAAEDCGGDRSAVMRVCEGLSRHHKGVVFRYATADDVYERKLKK